MIKTAFKILHGKNKKPFDIDGDGKVTFSDFKAIFSGERHQEADKLDFLKTRASEIWFENEPKFTLLSQRIQKREKKIKRTIWNFFASTEEMKIRSIVEDLVEKVADPDIVLVQEDYLKLLDEKNALESDISELKASASMQISPDKKLLRSIEKLESKHHLKSENIEATKILFSRKMGEYGTKLSNEQAEVLLSRIDADDITKMTTTFAVIAAITNQLSQAKVASGENIKFSKTYYGAYIGLLEMQSLIQTKYIEKIDSNYLTGISKIITEAESHKITTEERIKTADEHKSVYENNLNAVKFTISVSENYKKTVIENREKVIKARDIVWSLKQVAENILGTVRVSSELISLLKKSENQFDQVISLQVPELVPFENLQLQREFEAITGRLRKS
jgi:hypothetical protein